MDKGEHKRFLKIKKHIFFLPHSQLSPGKQREEVYFSRLFRNNLFLAKLYTLRDCSGIAERGELRKKGKTDIRI